MKKLLLIVLMGVTMGCAGGNLRPTDTERKDARQAELVRQGTVVESFSITIRGYTEAAQATGAAVGGYAANRAVQDQNEAVQILAAAAGAVVGSMVGDTTSDFLMDKPGINLIIKLDSGGTIAISQQRSSLRFNTGQRVYLIGADKQIRVLPQQIK